MGKTKHSVTIHFLPPIKWPLWVSDQETFDVEEITPISPDLKQLARLANAYFAANTEWCDPASMYFFSNRESYVESNRLAHALASRLIDELGSAYQVRPTIAKVNETGHAYFAANRRNRAPKNKWVEHVHL